jgi:hypothetical protein
MMVKDRFYLARFREFQRKHGPAFVWAHLVGPYDGCFYLNVLFFIKGDDAYITCDLKNTCYSDYRKPDISGSKYLRAGHMRATDIDKMLRRAEVEFHTFDDLVANTPNKLIPGVLSMLEELEIDPKCGERFKCRLCDDYIRADDEVQYLESEFRGDGGIGIDVGEPVHYYCYRDKCCCSYCGEEVDAELQDIEHEGEYHCCYCIPQQHCSVCHAEIRMNWGDERIVNEWKRSSCCTECADERAEEVEEVIKKIEQQGRAVAAAGSVGYPQGEEL